MIAKLSSSTLTLRVLSVEEELSAESEEEGDNPYSSYQQFHRDLSTHDDPKSELVEFELLEQGMFSLDVYDSCTYVYVLFSL